MSGCLEKNVKKIFLTCPVRTSVGEGEKKNILEYVTKLESEGITVHYPPRDTNQNDAVGTRICTENMDAIKEADEMHIYYVQQSQGIHFDIGMAFALGKKIKLVNKLVEESFANVLEEAQIKLDAIVKSDEVYFYYKPESWESHFDLGMVFALGKKIKLISKLEKTETKSFANVLLDIAGKTDYYKRE